MVLLKVFPQREQWDKPLLDLLVAAQNKIKEAKREDERDEPIPRRRVTLAAAEAIIRERDAAKAEARNMQAELTKLRKENEQLKTELAFLRGRLAELERYAQLPAA